MSKEIKKSKSRSKLEPSGKGLELAGTNLTAIRSALTKTELPRLFYQLVVFILDGSGSMSTNGSTGFPKGSEVENAVKGVIERLRSSKNKNSFDVAVWAYAEDCKQILQPTVVTQIDNAIDLNPCNHVEFPRRTLLKEALKSVSEQCQSYLKQYEQKTSQAIVLILSDGGIHDQEAAEDVASTMRSNKVTIGTTFLESADWIEKHDPEDLAFLQENLLALASHKDIFMSTLDPEEVRKHMIKSISFVSRLDS